MKQWKSFLSFTSLSNLAAAILSMTVVRSLLPIMEPQGDKDSFFLLPMPVFGLAVAIMLTLTLSCHQLETMIAFGRSRSKAFRRCVAEQYALLVLFALTDLLSVFAVRTAFRMPPADLEGNTLLLLGLVVTIALLLLPLMLLASIAFMRLLTLRIVVGVVTVFSGTMFAVAVFLAQSTPPAEGGSSFPLWLAPESFAWLLPQNLLPILLAAVPLVTFLSLWGSARLLKNRDF